MQGNAWSDTIARILVWICLVFGYFPPHMSVVDSLQMSMHLLYFAKVRQSHI